MLSASAATISVSTTVDAVNGNTSSISALQSSNGGDGISVREAIMAANNTAGAPHTINIPAGTYNLTISGGITTVGSGEGYAPVRPDIGDLDVMQSGISIIGAGAATTIIRQTTPTAGSPSNDRVIEINPNIADNFVFNMSGVTITGGKSPEYGGGMLSGGNLNVLTLTGCVFTNNTAINTASPGGGICNLGGGTLNLVDSTFVNNSTTASSGGGVYLDNNPAPGFINVTNCLFTNNVSASGSDGGGGLYVLGSGTSTVTKSTFINNRVTGGGGSGGGLFFGGSAGTMNVSLCSFAGNQATGGTGRGGGVHVNNGILNVSFCRFTGNTAPTGTAAFKNVGGTLTANDNWWGINTGPTAAMVSGSTPTRWLQLRHSAANSTILINNSTTLTADLFGRNIDGAISASTLVGLPPFPTPPTTIFGGATLGNLSAAGTQFVNGMATATYTGTTKGTGSITATSDSHSVAVLVTIEGPAAVTGVSSSIANGAYSGGQVIPISVTFSEAVTVTGTPTLTLETGSTDAVINYSSGSGSANLLFNYTVAAGHASADLDYISTSALALNGGTIKSGSLNNNASLTLPAPGAAGSLGANKAIVIDTTAPVITISNPSATAVNGGSVTYTVTYTDVNFSSSSLVTNNITLNKTSTANGTLAVSGSGNTRTVTISSISGSGTLGISIAAGTGSDTAGNTATAAGPSATFAVDTIAPTIAIVGPSASIANGSSSVTYTVNYADANFSSSSLTTNHITLNKTSTANGTLAVTGSGTSRTVTISGITGNGTLGISIVAGTASDTAGNTAPAAGPSTTFSVDTTAPTIAIVGPSASIANGSSSVTYAVNYTDANFSASSLTTNQITLNTTGFANGNIGVSGSGNNRTVTISGITGNGTLGISIAAGSASDTAGNTAPAAGPSTTFAVDTVAPTILISAPSSSLTSTNTTSYTVSYADANFSASTLSVGQVTLNKTGNADGTVGVSGTGTNRTVTISGITGNGTLGISIAAGTASDTAGNTSPAAGPSTTFTVDNTAPTITCPNTVISNAVAGTCSVTNVMLGVPVTSDSGGIASVTNNAPSTFPVGTNSVTWTVTDNVGLKNSCIQLVVIRDVQAPTITCPGNVLVTLPPGTTNHVVTFTVSANDICSSANVVSIPQSGSAFTAGVTTVTNIATDASGNSNVCTFTITLNRVPVAGTNTLGTVENQPVSVSTSQLLANNSDPDGDALTLNSLSTTSTNGGTVTLTNNTVTYTPVTGFVGEDRFTYGISDGRGGNSSVTVIVTVISQDSPALNHISIKRTVNGKLLRFVGVAGQGYIFQSAEFLTGWTNLTSALIANPAGLIEFEHTPNSSPTRFYRTVSAP